jgi:hypothetical protein
MSELVLRTHDYSEKAIRSAQQFIADEKLYHDLILSLRFEAAKQFVREVGQRTWK